MGQAHWKDWAETYRRICFDMFRARRICFGVEGYPSWSFESFELHVILQGLG
ncbi:hypothetical protein HanXRQr2_Chr02g0068821 [Helianthus annuus]|uniref:Uncharacterized protein n=1 Tax=Helianthus annuus TaxID=4232 RepID=A0A9K3JPB0_HELAN|nr:hypothetical protein HanXRQr2_Chr02g0068821 [Helianthus annuus]KAJ0821862.1 hypothetical protein HanPSC8_Chr16g0725191 [Helianthus annuus]